MDSHASHYSRLTTMRHTARPPRKPLILVVEDHDSARTALTKMLSATGYDVAEAQNGSEALAQLATGPRPDLILLDLMMPVMDGWEFRNEQLRDGMMAAIPVVLFSASGNVRDKAAELKLAAYLEKPIDLHTLLTMIESILGERVR